MQNRTLQLCLLGVVVSQSIVGFDINVLMTMLSPAGLPAPGGAVQEAAGARGERRGGREW